MRRVLHYIDCAYNHLIGRGGVRAVFTLRGIVCSRVGLEVRECALNRFTSPPVQRRLGQLFDQVTSRVTSRW